MPPQPKKRRSSTGVIHKVADYAHLQSFVDVFVEGHIPLLILIGGPGLGKSERFRRALAGSKGCWLEGNVTPFGMYEQLYKHADEPVVIDDVDGLCFDRSSVNLLKSLCQTVPKKLVSWTSNERYLEAHGLPPIFETRSKVVVITNNWRTLNRNVSSLEDRGFVVQFAPSVEEVHREAGTWFKDREIYDWFGENLHRVQSPTFRNYIRASVLKACRMDWRTVLGDLPKTRREALARQLVEDGSFATNEERALAFEKRGGGCRSTFFNYKRRIEAAG